LVNEDYYVDQASTSYNIYDRNISSNYTSYGIQILDSQYSKLIRNIDEKIVELYHRARRKAQHSNIKTKKVEESYHYYTYYNPIKPEDFNGWIDIKVVWENGNSYEFLYTPLPKINPKTWKFDRRDLKKHITNNPHLHPKIKENLLANLKNY